MAQENEDKLAANSDDKKRLHRAEIRVGGEFKAAAAKGQEIERKDWRSRAQLKPSPAAGDSTSFSSASNQQFSSSSMRPWALFSLQENGAI